MTNKIVMLFVTFVAAYIILDLDSKLTVTTRNWNRAETRLMQTRLQLEEVHRQNENCEDIITQCCK